MATATAENIRWAADALFTSHQTTPSALGHAVLTQTLFISPPLHLLWMPRADQRMAVDRSSLSHNLPKTPLLFLRSRAKQIHSYERGLPSWKGQPWPADQWSHEELLHQPGGDFVDSGGYFLEPQHINELNFIAMLDQGISLSLSLSLSLALSLCWTSPLSVNGPDMDSFAFMTNWSIGRLSSVPEEIWSQTQGWISLSKFIEVI